ncbi:MAG: ComEC/Rec2 family competence protein [Terracidiphilus sp.]|nr:ComEC/Rec2 family competence protein [Terracidiphilus sp.]MDR3776971.1 ComEC/Rec2 family competence protein [Terracidiphilus sp.]
MQAEDSSFGQTRPAFASLGAVPLFHAAWLFAAGVTLTHWLWLRPSLVLASLALVAVLCAVAALCAQRVAWLPLAVLWCLLGSWCAEMEPHPAPAPAVAALSDGLLRTVEGTVVDAGPIRSEMEQTLAEYSEPGPAAQAASAAPQVLPSQRIDLRVSTLEVVTDDEDAQLPATGGVRLTIRWPLDQPLIQPGPQPFRCGDRIRAEARLLPPETYHDPDVFSRADFLLDQGVTSTASVKIDRVERVGTAPGAFLACRVAGLQHASSARLLALPAAMRRLPAPLRLTSDDAIMLAAMVTGDRTYLTHSLRVGFERTGSFHMLVVSGFHLAIVAGCLFWVAKKLRLPRVPATIVTILASFGYALFTGFATPVQRSLWMVTLYLLGRLIYRERSPLNTIGFASLCLLAASPRSLFESSLQMTLLAVVAIAGVAAPLLQATIHPYLTATRDLSLIAIDGKLPPLQTQFRVTLRMIAARLQKVISPRRRNPPKVPPLPAIDDKSRPQLTLIYDTAGVSAAASHAVAHRRFAKSIAWRFFPWTIRLMLRFGELLVVSCVVELAMALPMAIYFHRITLFALPVNLFILPLLAVLMPAALVTLLALVTWPPAAVVPAAVVALMLHLGVGLVHLFGSLAWGDFRIPSPLLGQSAAFCALLGAAILLAHRAVSTASPWPRRAAWIALIAAAVAAVAPRPMQHPHDALLVEAIDVGQGDSLLLITPDGKTLLVDGGGFGGGPRQAPQDFDIGEDVVSEALWARGIRHLDVVALSHAHSDHMGGLPAVLRNFHPAELWVGNNPRVSAYNALLDEAEALHVQVRSFRAGDDFPLGRAQVSVLAPFPSYQPGLEPGNNDSLVLHVAYGATSVMLEGDAEAPVEQTMLAEPGLQSTLLKVGHHGSVTSTQPQFLARVAPQWAIISCGLRNRFGHPREEVLEELQAAHVRTYRTDINGAACFRLDGRSAAPEPGCNPQQTP